MHGWNAYQQQTYSLEEIRALAGPQVQYHPLEELSTEAFRLLELRNTLGLRSCFNTVLRMWNPSGAAATVQGVFHPSYRSLQAQAAALLGQHTLSIMKGGGGEFERHPSKDITIFGLRDGAHIQHVVAAQLAQTRRLHEVDAQVDPAALWEGRLSDPFAQATVTGTAALALWTLNVASTPSETQQMAEQLWAQRLSFGHSFKGISA